MCKEGENLKVLGFEVFPGSSQGWEGVRCSHDVTLNPERWSKGGKDRNKTNMFCHSRGKRGSVGGFRVYGKVKGGVKSLTRETSLVVQWLRLCASNPGGVGSVSGQGTRILHAFRLKKEKRLTQVRKTLINPIKIKSVTGTSWPRISGSQLGKEMLAHSDHFHFLLRHHAMSGDIFCRQNKGERV